MLWGAGCSCHGCDVSLAPTGISPSRLEKTCVDLLQATLGLAACPEQLQVLCAAILREMSPSDSLSLVWDHTQNSRQLSLVASVLLAQVAQQSPPQLAVLPRGPGASGAASRPACVPSWAPTCYVGLLGLRTHSSQQGMPQSQVCQALGTEMRLEQADTCRLRRPCFLSPLFLGKQPSGALLKTP